MIARFNVGKFSSPDKDTPPIPHVEEVEADHFEADPEGTLHFIDDGGNECARFAPGGWDFVKRVVVTLEP